MQNFVGGCEVFDFVAQYLDAPVKSSFVNGGHHLGVDDVAFFKSFVEFKLADDAAQAGLGQLGDGNDVVR